MTAINPKPAIAAPSEVAEPADPFDLSRLRLDQSFTEMVGVKKLLTTVPVRRPSSAGFCACAPERRIPCRPRGHRAQG